MHSGNATRTDRQIYQRAGAHGTVGKGEDVPASIAKIYAGYMKGRVMRCWSPQFTQKVKVEDV